MDEEFGTIKLSYYANDGLKDASGYFSDIVVGGQANSIIDNPGKEEFIRFYPSLVSDHLNFACEQNIQNLSVSLFDISGQVVHTSSYSNASKGVVKEINVNNLPIGLFILRAISDQGAINFKIIKQ